jgi:Family of unknown function (DUF6788)
MSTTKTANPRSHRLLQYVERYNALKAEFQTIGFICQGSLQTRRLACGNPNCRCQQDPQLRHGPYHYWTRKQRGKTVGLKLTDEELAIYSEWIQNNRKLERILRQMRAVSAHALGLTSGKAPL